MTFEYGHRTTVLFDGWETQTWGQYVLALVLVFILSILHEFLTSLRINRLARVVRSTVVGCDPCVLFWLRSAISQWRWPHR